MNSRSILIAAAAAIFQCLAGGRHVRVTGIDVLSDTPEGTALLDGILDYLAGR